jgi:hypothetical protein
MFPKTFSFKIWIRPTDISADMPIFEKKSKNTTTEVSMSYI